MTKDKWEIVVEAKNAKHAAERKMRAAQLACEDADRNLAEAAKQFLTANEAYNVAYQAAMAAPDKPS